MRWSFIENGVIQQTVTALPTKWSHKGSFVDVRDFWGRNEDVLVNSFGWFFCKEVIEPFDEFTHKFTGNFTVSLVEDLPVATSVLEVLTEEEVEDIIFQKVVQLKVNLKLKALSEIQKIMPMVSSFESMFLAVTLVRCISEDARTLPSDISTLISIYETAKLEIENVNTINSVESLSEYSIDDVVWL